MSIRGEGNSAPADRAGPLPHYHYWKSPTTGELVREFLGSRVMPVPGPCRGD